jgi:hypothetical protein
MKANPSSLFPMIQLCLTLIIIVGIIVILVGYLLNEKYPKTIEHLEQEQSESKPYLLDEDRLLFDKYLTSARRYFEFGAGKSTATYVSQLGHIEAICSVQNERKLYEQVKNQLKGKSNVDLIYVDTDSDNQAWGYPVSQNGEKFKKYYQSYNPEFKADLIMVDGRFRVSCCLDLYTKICPRTLIFFDDFMNRKHYHHILKYYDVIETGNIAAVLRLKCKEVDPKELEESIRMFSLDPR